MITISITPHQLRSIAKQLETEWRKSKPIAPAVVWLQPHGADPVEFQMDTDHLLCGCDTCGKRDPVKRLVTGVLEDGSTSAVFLCHRCWGTEMRWRRGRQAEGSDPLPIIRWSDVRYLNAETGEVV